MIVYLAIPIQALFGQLTVGLINGSFYALLSLGLAVIFGLLNIINFTHGAQYMLGAFVAWMLLNYLGIGYWWALLLAPLIVGAFGIVLERTLISRLYKIDHTYGLLLTFGLALIFQGVLRDKYGVSGIPYAMPPQLTGGQNLGFMFLPNYRAWAIAASIVVCFGTWFLIERTRLGAYLRASTENSVLTQGFGINVPLLVTLTYGFGVALAAFAGVLAAPIYSVNPNMGADVIIVVFAVVVIGGMGSILGAIVSGYALGLIEGLTKVFYPEASTTVIFVIMAIVLLVKPAGLFGKEGTTPAAALHSEQYPARDSMTTYKILFAFLAVLLAIAPFVLYPVFVMSVLCFALLACAFNLLLGYGGLLSFGHAAYFGMAAYVAGHAAKILGVTPEVALLLGAATGAALGLAFGALAIRRQGIYFSMITLALAQMAFFFCLQAKFTHGEDGIQAIPRGKLFGIVDLSDDRSLYVFIAVLFMAGLLAIFRIVNSPFGEVLKAIRENEPRAISLGYNAPRYKLLVFVLSTTIAGLAGSMKALVSQLATLTDVHWTMSGEIVLMTLLGGVGTMFGPIVGAIVIVTMQNYLAQLGAWVTVVQGLIFVICVLSFREGIVGVLARRLKLRL